MFPKLVPLHTNRCSQRLQINQEQEQEDIEAILAQLVPEAGYTITTEPMGPGGCYVHTLMVHLGVPGHPEPLVFETGKIGHQAAGAVTLAWGESTRPRC